MIKIDAPNIVRRYPLRVEDFLLLDRNRAFEGYGKTELIDGGVVYMNAQHRPHARIKGQLWRLLDAALIETDFTVLTEVTVAMPPHDAPEPDLVLTTQPSGEGPVPLVSVALIIEISDTTLQYDLGIKAELYARHDVPEYWVINLNENRALLHMSPTDGNYAEQIDVPFGEPLHSGTIEGLSVETDGLI
jgi:Uma2 family endonuclease